MFLVCQSNGFASVCNETKLERTATSERGSGHIQVMKTVDVQKDSEKMLRKDVQKGCLAASLIDTHVRGSLRLRKTRRSSRFRKCRLSTRFAPRMSTQYVSNRKLVCFARLKFRLWICFSTRACRICFPFSTSCRSFNKLPRIRRLSKLRVSICSQSRRVLKMFEEANYINDIHWIFRRLRISRIFMIY